MALIMKKDIASNPINIGFLCLIRIVLKPDNILHLFTASIKKLGGETEFTYKISNELVDARADCQGNRWYASKYGWNRAQSPATQEMLWYVCR